MEAEVRHRRDDDLVARQPPGDLQVARQQRDDLVAVDDGPVCVDGEHAVGVAVEREPEVEAARAHAARERVQMRRADAVVDVDAVGLGGGDLVLDAELREDERRDRGGGAVGAVDEHAQRRHLDRRPAAACRPGRVALGGALERA